MKKLGVFAFPEQRNLENVKQAKKTNTDKQNLFLPQVKIVTVITENR